MKEQYLLDYFNNKADIKSLAIDLDNSRDSWGDCFALNIDYLENENSFPILRTHALQLCADVIEKKISFENLNTIAFVVSYSDNFRIDRKDEILVRFFDEWTETSFGFAWTFLNVQKWIELLEFGIDSFDDAELKNKED